jgi:hypothetical protein
MESVNILCHVQAYFSAEILLKSAIVKKDQSIILWDALI